MPLFSRRKDPSDEAGSAPEQASPRLSSDTVAELRPGRRRTVGQLLRETRESFGSDIPRVAAALRIRADYIEAIEEGRYDRLPAAVYALGFLKGYAVHLGLDGEEAVRRFKLEAAGLEAQRDLSFPVPLAERSVPGGALVLAALILAICGYGLWYYLSSSARPRLERVAPVPAELAAPLPPDDSSAPAPAPPAAVAPVAPVAPVTPEEPPQPPSAAAPQRAPTAAAPRASPPLVPTAVAATAPAPPPVTPPSSPAIAVLPAVEPGSLPAAEPPSPAAEASPPPVPPLPPTAALSRSPAASAAAAPDQPHQYGLANGQTRIVIRAVSESWIQVRDRDMKAIFHRKLLPGDTYRVPDQPGLALTTGKGTGLAIMVDGRQTPPIGGAVHKNVILDPDRLLAGTAVE
jgi:cytoskeleton protein RodZ